MVRIDTSGRIIRDEAPAPRPRRGGIAGVGSLNAPAVERPAAQGAALGAAAPWAAGGALPCQALQTAAQHLGVHGKFVTVPQLPSLLDVPETRLPMIYAIIAAVTTLFGGQALVLVGWRVLVLLAGAYVFTHTTRTAQ
ncbi:hypothetical protein M885DRAFT_580111 [Pelagophyceae sp. CCMP2097]|nr:hypothetical protein M885DRAFT_580111 [Pelagophyceae sp. CCMP2097]